jgi:signal peptidase I
VVVPALLVPVMAAMIVLALAGLVATAVARAGVFRGWGPTLLGAAILVVAARGVRAGVAAFQIPSDAMRPTLLPGDHVLVSKFHKAPGRGEVIVFRYPFGPDDYIKRVIGLPGDTVASEHGQVLINGVPLPRRMLGDACSSRVGSCHVFEEKAGDRTYRVVQEDARPSPDFAATVVPAGHYYVMGDNRDNSQDSRVWGPLRADLIKGRVTAVTMSSAPGQRWRRIGRPVE